MNIGAQFQTKEGNIYIADVVNQKIMKIDQAGEKTKWQKYVELKDGQVGKSLIVTWPGKTRKPLKTSEIIKLEFPKLED